MLGKEAALNPYGTRACAFVEQLVFLNKPRSLFSDGEDFTLNVDITTFEKLCIFSKKYTGIDFSHSPMSLGNILIFSCSQRLYSVNQKNEIILTRNEKYDYIIVHFRLDDLVVCTRIIECAHLSIKQDIEISSDEPWNTHDIEIYSNGKLVYFDKNVTYMRSLTINITVAQAGHTVPLKKLGRDFYLPSNGRTLTTIGGEIKTITEQKLERSERAVLRKLNAEKSDQMVLFVKPNEVQKAMDFIKSELNKTSKQIWLFDSYFSDRNRAYYAKDWIRILAFCPIEEKNIVFYNNPIKPERNPITPAEFSEFTQTDPDIWSKLSKNELLRINFIQTKKYIHDRFLFIVDHDNYIKGISFGTSLNSLDSNYYCIYKLNNGTARIILDELKICVDTSNIKEMSSL